MLTANFYNFGKKINSTKQPSSTDIVFTDSICFIEPTTFMTPSIKISRASLTPNSINYVWINGFGYYFITGAEWVDGAWQFNLKYDSLANYKNEIGLSTEYIVRCYTFYDPYLPDGKYPANSNIERVMNAVYQSGSVYSGFPAGSLNQGCYIVGLVNRDAYSVGGVSYYAFNDTNFRLFMRDMFEPSTYFSATGQDLETLKASFNPIQYVVSCKWFPYTYDFTSGTINAITLGWYTLTGSWVAKRLTGSLHYELASATVNIPKHPQSTERKWLNGSPYTRLYFQMFPFGDFPIDPSTLIDEVNLIVTLQVDVISGDGLLSVYKGGRMYIHQQQKIGVDIQLSQVLPQTANQVRSIFGVAKSASPTEILSSIGTSVLNAVLDYKESWMPQVQTNGGNGSVSQYGTSTQPYLIGEFMKVVDENEADYGRPLCKNKQINTMSGFIMCSDVHPMYGCNTDINNEIKRLMEEGFFYE